MNKNKNGTTDDEFLAEVRCVNCFMHGCETPKKQSLFRCTSCSMVQYCGKACRDEHWEKVHKNHCKYLADPALAVFFWKQNVDLVKAIIITRHSQWIGYEFIDVCTTC